jgi:hypothetical protein
MIIHSDVEISLTYGLACRGLNHGFMGHMSIIITEDRGSIKLTQIKLTQDEADAE